MVENMLDPFKMELECTQNRPMWNPIQRDQLLTVYWDPRLLPPANQLFQFSIQGEPVVNSFYILSFLPLAHSLTSALTWRLDLSHLKS